MKNNNTHCLNCGQQLLGDYCHICGQENIDTKLTFFELVRDFLGDMFTYDSRFYRTIVPLLIKPGFLTLEFFNGKRIPYVPPLRLYLFISFVLFLWLALAGGNTVNIGSPERANEEISRGISATIDTDTSDLGEGWLRDINENAKVITENPKAFMDLVTSRFPYLMFVLLPVFALVMWLHFAFSGYNYLQHLVFALHFHSFMYLVVLLFSLTNKIFPWDYGLWALLVFNGYIAIAMRKTYGSSIAGCILKTLSILTLYMTIFGLALAGFIVINVLSFG